jgi:hypothetical protein
MKGKDKMLKRKLAMMLVAALATALVTAGAASSASAKSFELTSEPCHPGNGKFGVCWGTSEATALAEPLELEGEEEVTAKSTTVALFVVPSIPVEIECLTVTNSGIGIVSQTSPLGVAKNTISGILKFGGMGATEECKLVGTNTVAERCEIPKEKNTVELQGEAINATEVHLLPKTGTVFIEIPFASKAGFTCPATVIGTRKVTGFQNLIVNADGKASLVGAAVAESGLKFIEKQAKLTGSIEVKFINQPEDWLTLTET